MKVFKNPTLIIAIICICLTIIPFFWMKSNEMDLGGDSSRLYFYDPIAYLKNFGLYDIFPEGTGKVDPNYYFMPYVLFIWVLKLIGKSPYVVISLINDLKLVVGFLSIYLLMKELLSFKKEELSQNTIFSEIASICTGLFYVFMPSMILNYDKALTSHNQVFINPLMIYLILKFFLSNNKIYLLLFLIISFIFSPSFALTSAPPLFAFFPLTILFILVYILVIRKQKISLQSIFLTVILFLFIQTFQLVPQIQSLFDPGSFSNTRVFDKQSIYNEGVRYFTAVLPLAKSSVNIFLPTPITQVPWILLPFPLLIIFGCALNKKSKTFLLTGVFFLITFFLLTGHVTDAGVWLYEQLFYIPGFSMFRNFIGQWMFVYSFFYALFFGQAFYILIAHLKNKKVILLLFFLVCVPLFIAAWPFINGSLVNKDWYPPHNRHIAVTMDPDYVKTLDFIHNLPDDSKLLTLPLTDPYYQVLSGANNGVYIGPSTIAYIAGKNDFDGYQILAPFSEVLLRLNREKNYPAIRRMLGILNIHYIFYNSDPKIYDASYIAFPYQYVRQSLPKSGKEYQNFLEKDLQAKNIYSKGFYNIYVLDNAYLPHIYTTTQISCYINNKNDWYDKNYSFFEDEKNNNQTTTYLLMDACRNISSTVHATNSTPIIAFHRINPTEYSISVHNAEHPYLLTFLEQYNPNWKLFSVKNATSKNKVIASYLHNSVQEENPENIFFYNGLFTPQHNAVVSEKYHVITNGYANGWYITPSQMNNSEDYQFILEMANQKIFYICLTISILTFVLSIVWILFLIYEFVKSTAIIKKM